MSTITTVQCAYCDHRESKSGDWEWISDLPICRDCQSEILTCDECGVVVAHVAQGWHDGIEWDSCPYAMWSADICMECADKWEREGCCDECRDDASYKFDPNTHADYIYKWMREEG